MTDPSRGMRVRRVNRRPGWVLLTVLLVLAIVSSTVLVFTNRVELLKLAVVLALWAAVAAAFASFIYRRQSDLDQAKVRDLKYVYDLQLDREISARREYELAVETQLRRELSAELRAQSSDEVAALRAELAALRANLEILFDADLDERPALETERPAGRVIASRIDAPVRSEAEPRTEESPIIDVPAEPQPPEFGWAPPAEPVGGAHRRASENPQGEQSAPPWQRRTTTPTPAPTVVPPRVEPVEPAEPLVAQWNPAPADGQWIPAGAPGSNWSPPVPPPPTPPPAPAPTPMPDAVAEREVRRGRHANPDMAETSRRSRHAVPPEADQAPPVDPPVDPMPPAPAPRHRGPDDAPAAPEPEPGGQHSGGQPVSELLSRLQASPGGGGRRRRREE
ncbi:MULTISPECIES: DUF6779 domain-containing protein [Mycobacteriaceae]|uniref:Membrane protein n=1 Tax=Mycolicibacterium neoaurum VKM Ac-1815D TaxID=700508 RepID=V5XGQ0_MYCNE|nr:MULTISPECIES: DUF6779 domain-containing protein [Mycobacteriaceae]AHC27605.1 membrane protein [Mycolicibacterium neoaurum VKM Ac-1815D]AMO07794.1 membrane protein [Mycolicibacterium neoaurum]AXK73801.1 hypothetical protein DXK33_00315 [Mycolicibacterium neoaurum]KJQ49627.1 membrane protein [Mycolicibacterium neoaurum]KUM06197.1 hypothetical protein AVZ31_22480 [Mycolicibacterium neoaurum]